MGLISSLKSNLQISCRLTIPNGTTSRYPMTRMIPIQMLILHPSSDGATQRELNEKTPCEKNGSTSTAKATKSVKNSKTTAQARKNSKKSTAVGKRKKPKWLKKRKN